MTVEEAIAAALEPVIRRVVAEEFEKARAIAAQPPRPLSAAAAAKRVRVRVSVLLAALEEGKVKARFVEGCHGGRGRWEIDPSAADKWAEARR